MQYLEIIHFHRALLLRESPKPQMKV